MGAVLAKVGIMLQQIFALILIVGAFDSAFGQFKCENQTLPDGSTCPNDGPIDHTYPDPDHCSMFWDCYNGCLTKMVCQLDYLYDTAHGWCDYPQKVHCGDRDCDGRPCNDDNNDDIDFDCEAAGGDGYYADPANCIKYIHCSAGVAESLICQKSGGKQLQYRPSNVQCDYPDRVECGDRPVCDENNENCHQDATTTTPKPSPCDNIDCDHGDDFYPEGPCKGCFCQCRDGVQDEVCCSPGLVFNPATNRCDWPANVNGC